MCPSDFVFSSHLSVRRHTYSRRTLQNWQPLHPQAKPGIHQGATRSWSTPAARFDTDPHYCSTPENTLLNNLNNFFGWFEADNSTPAQKSPALCRGPGVCASLQPVWGDPSPGSTLARLQGLTTFPVVCWRTVQRSSQMSSQTCSTPPWAKLLSPPASRAPPSSRYQRRPLHPASTTTARLHWPPSSWSASSGWSCSTSNPSSPLHWTHTSLHIGPAGRLMDCLGLQTSLVVGLPDRKTAGSPVSAGTHPAQSCWTQGPSKDACSAPFSSPCWPPDCTPSFSNNLFVEFADDTTVVGLIDHSDESNYREEVSQPTGQVAQRHQSLSQRAEDEGGGCRLPESLHPAHPTPQHHQRCCCGESEQHQVPGGASHWGPLLERQLRITGRQSSAAPLLSPQTSKSESTRPQSCAPSTGEPPRASWPAASLCGTVAALRPVGGPCSA